MHGAFRLLAFKCEPELNAVLVIFDAALLVVALHDRLDDRESDAAAPVLTGPGFIHLIELLPDLIDILLWDRISGIEHGNADEAVLPDDPHVDLLIMIEMVQRITHIVGDDFLDLEFISPDKNRILSVHRDLRSLLLKKQRHAGNNAPDQLRDIEPLHRHLFRAELELVQREQLADHIVHLGGLIDNNVAVEVPALRILRDIVLESLRIAGDQRDRRLQLMGHIVKELFAHLIDLRFSLIVLQKLDICSLKLADRLLQLSGATT